MAMIGLHLTKINVIRILFINYFLTDKISSAIKVTSKVPGSIYTDLKRNGTLKQDFYYGNNDINYRWVANDNWTFVKNFHGQ